jgi:hypothetical protein
MIRGEGGLLDLNRICGLEQEKNTKVQWRERTKESLTATHTGQLNLGPVSAL